MPKNFKNTSKDRPQAFSCRVEVYGFWNCETKGGVKQMMQAGFGIREFGEKFLITTNAQTPAKFRGLSAKARAWRSHKVIVALTVKEILDEQIAKKLA